MSQTSTIHDSISLPSSRGSVNHSKTRVMPAPRRIESAGFKNQVTPTNDDTRPNGRRIPVNPPNRETVQQWVQQQNQLTRQHLARPGKQAQTMMIPPPPISPESNYYSQGAPQPQPQQPVYRQQQQPLPPHPQQVIYHGIPTPPPEPGVHPGNQHPPQIMTISERIYDEPVEVTTTNGMTNLNMLNRLRAAPLNELQNQVQHFNRFTQNKMGNLKSSQKELASRLIPPQMNPNITINNKKKQIKAAVPQMEISRESEIKKRKKFKRNGYFMLVISVVCLFTFDGMLDAIFESQFRLEDGNVLTYFWKQTPIMINLDIYLFGIKNGPQFVQGAKPHLVEYGPFSYKIGRTRKVVEWGPETVTFIESYQAEFDPTRSASLDTRMILMNLPIVGAAVAARSIMENFYVGWLSPIINNIVVSVLRFSGESVLDNRSARDLLEGRQLSVLIFLDYIVKPLKAAGVPIPDYWGFGNLKIINNTVGLVPLIKYGAIGPLEFYTRTENGHLFNSIASIMGDTRYLKNKPPCDRIYGSDPLLFGTRLKDPYITMNYALACRPLHFYRNKTHWLSGTRVVRYVLPVHMYDMRRPENHCYCQEGHSLEECDGWFEISGCAFGVPAGLSFPHFLGSPRRQSELRGLRPDSKRHATYLEMEPNLGAPVHVKLGLQANLAIRPFPGVLQLSTLPKAVMPIAWIHIDLGADDFWFTAIGLAIFSAILYHGSYIFSALFASLAMLNFYRASRITKSLR